MHRILLFFICVSNFLFVRADNFWRINKDGGITWDIQNGQSHKDKTGIYNRLLLNIL